MKRYFLFDNEPVTGWNYFLRLIVGQLLIVIIIGFWLIAATAYKRAGSLDWSKEARVLCAIAIPIHIIINIMADEIEFSDFTFALIALLLAVVHLVLLFKNGNKKIDQNIFKQ